MKGAWPTSQAGPSTQSPSPVSFSTQKYAPYSSFPFFHKEMARVKARKCPENEKVSTGAWPHQQQSF